MFGFDPSALPASERAALVTRENIVALQRMSPADQAAAFARLPEDEKIRIIEQAPEALRASLLASLPDDQRARILGVAHARSAAQTEVNAMAAIQSGTPAITLSANPGGRHSLNIDRDGDGDIDIRLTESANGFVLSANGRAIVLGRSWLAGHMTGTEQSLASVSLEQLGRIAATTIDTARALRLTPEVYTAI